MPLIYGKTIISMSNDIFNHYSTLLDKKESTKLATHIYEYFQIQFPHIINLMDLVRDIGWISAASDKPVFYSIPLLTSVQDYMRLKNVNIWVYDRIQKKKRQVTLRIPTEVRDRRKTHTSTFANFIHQKDANIAMFMIYEIINMCAPVYTVHDNFITTAPYAMHISKCYLEIFIIGRAPLYTINYFITRNLLDGWGPQYSLDRPLPLNYLKDILEYQIPKKISNTNKKIWDNKINSILKAYKYYIITSCNYDYDKNKDESEKNYNHKWDDFKNHMGYWDEFKYNYSLHL